MAITQRAFHWRPSSGGRCDGRFPEGPPPVPPLSLSWNTAIMPPLTGLLNSVSFSLNVRQYLTGDNAALATLNVVAPAGSGWNMTGDVLTNTGRTPGSGGLTLTAIYQSDTAVTPSLSWSIQSAPLPSSISFSLSLSISIATATFDTANAITDEALTCSGNCPTVVTSPRRSPNGKAMKTVVSMTTPVIYRTEAAAVAKTSRLTTTLANAQANLFKRHCWYGISIYFPADFANHATLYEIPFQFHALGTGSNTGPCALYIADLTHASERTPGTLYFAWQGDDRQQPAQPAQSSGFEKFNIFPRYDHWMDFIFHVVWDPSTAKQGSLEVWVDDVKYASRNNIQIGYVVPTVDGKYGLPYVKFGMYRGIRGDGSNEVVKSRTLYHDEFRHVFDVVDGYDIVNPVTWAGPRT